MKLRRAKALTSAALSDFGVPLEKDFPAFVTTREHVGDTGSPIYDKDAGVAQACPRSWAATSQRS